MAYIYQAFRHKAVTTKGNSMKFLDKPIKSAAGELSVIALNLILLTMTLTYGLIPPKYKPLTSYPSFGGVCTKSEGELTQTLTVVKEEPSGSYDTLCVSGTGKYRLYSTKEGIYFDTFALYTSGDIVTVTGKYYVTGKDRITISGDLIDDVAVKRIPLLPILPTATPINVRIEP